MENLSHSNIGEDFTDHGIMSEKGSNNEFKELFMNRKGEEYFNQERDVLSKMSPSFNYSRDSKYESPNFAEKSHSMSNPNTFLLSLPESNRKRFDTILMLKQTKDIIVSHPTIHRDTLGSYVSYKIKNQNEFTESVNVERRYREFALLRERMKKCWPGVFIPPIPQKKTSGLLETAFIEKRRSLLNNFCRSIECSYYLKNSEEYCMFTNECEIDKEFAKPPPNYDSIAKKYKYIFENLCKRQNPYQSLVDVKEKINHFYKSSLVSLQNLARFASAFKCHNDQLKFQIINSFFIGAQAYEKEFLNPLIKNERLNSVLLVSENCSGFVNKNITTGVIPNVSASASQEISGTSAKHGTNDANPEPQLACFPKHTAHTTFTVRNEDPTPYEELSKWIELEELDLTALSEAIASFLELFTIKDNLNLQLVTVTNDISNLILSKFSFKFFFTLKKKADIKVELEEERKRLQNEISSIETIIKCSSLSLIEYIDQIRPIKIDAYIKAINTCAKMSSNNLLKGKEKLGEFVSALKS